MAKSAFAFRLGQRVNVPGKKGVQGVISLPTHTGEMHLPITGIGHAPISYHVFFVRYLREDGMQTHDWFGDCDLVFANNQDDLPVTVENLTSAVTDNSARKSEADLSLQGTRHRLRAESSRHKPARKSKSKRRK